MFDGLAHLGAALAAGFLGGVAAWGITTFVGRPLARFYDLRNEAQELIFVYANVAPIGDTDRAAKGQEELRRLAARSSALSAVLPRIVARMLVFHGYDLEQATRGLTGLSNSLLKYDGLRGWNRTMAQRGLRLPVDPADEQRFSRSPN